MIVLYNYKMTTAITGLPHNLENNKFWECTSILENQEMSWKRYCLGKLT